MQPEIFVLALAAVLLVAHIQLAIRFKTKQYGTDWNIGARDAEMPPLNPVAGRVAYLPLYWSGVKGWRTAAWSVATLAILIVLGVLLFG